MSDAGERGPVEKAPQQTGRADLVVMGRVSGIYGVEGWIRVFSYTSPMSNILAYSPWHLYQDGQWTSRELLEGRTHGKGLLARIEGCTDRDRAADLMGLTIAVERDQLAPTEPGEYYWNDLQGLQVHTVDGVDLGRIDHLFETGSNDVMVVKGDRDRLIPYIWGDVVRRVDLDSGRMLVDWEADF